MFQLDLISAIWIFVVIFMIHDFEEIITVEKWSKRVEEKVKRIDLKLGYIIWKFWSINSYQFAKRDIVIFMIASMITFLKVQFIDSAWAANLYGVFLVIVMIHNVIHLFQTVILRTYTPGLYTSVFLVFPYTIYLMKILF